MHSAHRQQLHGFYEFAILGRQEDQTLEYLRQLLVLELIDFWFQVLGEPISQLHILNEGTDPEQFDESVC